MQLSMVKNPAKHTGQGFVELKLLLAAPLFLIIILGLGGISIFYIIKKIPMVLKRG